ncbi:MAG: diguanylate cyclase [Ruminococcus sp.]|nr:diguanylate cyclase [Ruminococcus sp.]
MSDGIYVFDTSGRCIWANDRGFELIGVADGELDKVVEGLRIRFGSFDDESPEWTESRVIGRGDDAGYFSLDKRSVNADSKHIAGSFLVISDNTEEQRRLRRELYNSTHDSLTGLFTKQHLYDCIRQALDKDHDTLYSVLFLDVKNFKIVNDIQLRFRRPCLKADSRVDICQYDRRLRLRQTCRRYLRSVYACR